MIIRITAIVIGLIALVMTFKAKPIVVRLLKKEPDEDTVLRVKYIALGLAVIAFLTVFIFGK